MKRTMLLSLVMVIAVASAVQAFGPDGHKMVGNIADQHLKGKAVADRIGKLLDGITLLQAATIPDEIKSWDSKKPRAGRTRLRNHPAIEKQMIAYHKANPQHSGNDHRSYHYTDVPVEGNERYADGSKGREMTDIVHMITYCVRVLNGEISEDNPRAITKPVAVILLAHFVGDIHQPLHVGAEYFDDQANPVNPDVTQTAQADTGGNDITLVIMGLSGHGHGHGATSPTLHGFWDDAAVDIAMNDIKDQIQDEQPGMQDVSDDDVAKRLAAKDPGGLENDAKTDPRMLAEAWADEILPIARDAHDQLDFSKIVLQGRSESAMAMAHKHGPKWMATEKSPGTYGDFAGKTVLLEMHKGAGDWRRFWSGR